MLALALGVAAAPATAGCLLGCDEALEGEAAAALLPEVLPLALPEGAGVAGLVTGGFQDRFLQLKLEVTDAALAPTLAALGADPGAFVPAHGAGLGPAGPAWWDPASREDLRGGPAAAPGYAHATVAVGPGAEGWTLYLWAFQT